MSVLHFVWNTREDYTHKQVVRNKVIAASSSFRAGTCALMGGQVRSLNGQKEDVTDNARRVTYSSSGRGPASMPLTLA
jgi:hypothetical protein